MYGYLTRYSIGIGGSYLLFRLFLVGYGREMLLFSFYLGYGVGYDF